VTTTRRYDQQRGTRTERGYNNRWLKARASYLLSHPLCVYCEKLKRVTAATVVDHIVPHRGDQALFWDKSNWQSLCKPHHDAAKQAEDQAGIELGCDADGIPLSSAHRWNRP